MLNKNLIWRALTVKKCQTFAPIAGWARQTGENIIFVDDRDPFRHGFQVK